MAQLKYELVGDFHTVLSELDAAVSQSLSSSFEAEHHFDTDSCRCVTRVYERYSWFGGNRVSLSITLLEADGHLFVSAITSGGSTAMFFKWNTVGEDAFLQSVLPVFERYRNRKP